MALEVGVLETVMATARAPLKKAARTLSDRRSRKAAMAKAGVPTKKTSRATVRAASVRFSSKALRWPLRLVSWKR